MMQLRIWLRDSQIAKSNSLVSEQEKPMLDPDPDCEETMPTRAELDHMPDLQQQRIHELPAFSYMLTHSVIRKTRPTSTQTEEK
jgi:hypothetical protein